MPIMHKTSRVGANQTPEDAISAAPPRDDTSFPVHASHGESLPVSHRSGRLPASRYAFSGEQP